MKKELLAALDPVLGTREAYLALVKQNTFSQEEKDILALARQQLNKKMADESILLQAYELLKHKQLLDTSNIQKTYCIFEDVTGMNKVLKQEKLSWHTVFWVDEWNLKNSFKTILVILSLVYVLFSIRSEGRVIALFGVLIFLFKKLLSTSTIKANKLRKEGYTKVAEVKAISEKEAIEIYQKSIKLGKNQFDNDPSQIFTENTKVKSYKVVGSDKSSKNKVLIFESGFGLQAVEDKFWSWPAFFFGTSWCIYYSIWNMALLSIIFWVLIGGSYYGAGLWWAVASFFVRFVIVGYFYGTAATKWRINALKRQGYTKASELYAFSEEEAITIYKKTQARTSKAMKKQEAYSMADELKKLAQLRQESVLTEEEFQARKKHLLNS